MDVDEAGRHVQARNVYDLLAVRRRDVGGHGRNLAAGYRYIAPRADRVLGVDERSALKHKVIWLAPRTNRAEEG